MEDALPRKGDKAYAAAARLDKKLIHVGVLTSNCAGSWYVSTLLSIGEAQELRNQIDVAIENASNKELDV